MPSSACRKKRNKKSTGPERRGDWAPRKELVLARGGGRRHLCGGTGAGVLLAAGLGALMLGLQSQLAGQALDAFQTGALFAAAALIAQMVAWMNVHGRHIRRELETSMTRAAERAGGWSCALLAALAVGREGAETVLFLYGIAAERRGGGVFDMVIGSLLGFLLAR